MTRLTAAASGAQTDTKENTAAVKYSPRMPKRKNFPNKDISSKFSESDFAALRRVSASPLPFPPDVLSSAAAPRTLGLLRAATSASEQLAANLLRIDRFCSAVDQVNNKMHLN